MEPMNVALAFRYGALLLTLVGALLAVRSAIKIPTNLALSIVTIWGSGTVTAKVVLEQKAYSAGSAVAIIWAFLFQLLGEVPLFTRIENQRGHAVWIGAAVLATVIGALTGIRRQKLVRPLLALMARQRQDAELADVHRVMSSKEGFVEIIGEFYDLPRRKRENLDTYQKRLVALIRTLSTDPSGLPPF